MEEEQHYRKVDPTDDETTNLKDDGSTDSRPIEEQGLAEDERPDAHIGTVPGQVDERMADAAAQIRHEHDEESERAADFRAAERGTPDGYSEP